MFKTNFLVNLGQLTRETGLKIKLETYLEDGLYETKSPLLNFFVEFLSAS
jgi:hypothetical protein